MFKSVANIIPALYTQRIAGTPKIIHVHVYDKYQPPYKGISTLHPRLSRKLMKQFPHFAKERFS